MPKIMRNDSNGGVGAKMASCPGSLISRATNLLRTLGLSSSPLLVSTQRTLMGLRPMRRIASSMDLSSQTPLALKYSISCCRAALHRSGTSGRPVRSSNKSVWAARDERLPIAPIGHSRYFIIGVEHDAICVVRYASLPMPHAPIAQQLALETSEDGDAQFVLENSCALCLFAKALRMRASLRSGA